MKCTSVKRVSFKRLTSSFQIKKEIDSFRKYIQADTTRSPKEYEEYIGACEAAQRDYILERGKIFEKISKFSPSELTSEMVLTCCHSLHENEGQLEKLYQNTAQKLQDCYQDCESYLEENFRKLKEKLEVLKASPEVLKAVDEGKDLFFLYSLKRKSRRYEIPCEITV